MKFSGIVSCTNWQRMSEKKVQKNLSFVLNLKNYVFQVPDPLKKNFKIFFHSSSAFDEQQPPYQKSFAKTFQKSLKTCIQKIIAHNPLVSITPVCAIFRIFFSYFALLIVVLPLWKVSLRYLKYFKSYYKKSKKLIFSISRQTTTLKKTNFLSMSEFRKIIKNSKQISFNNTVRYKKTK